MGTTRASDTVTYMAQHYTSARNRYQPKKVSLLFVAESPPSSDGYFYFDKTVGKDHLFRETMKALRLWPIGLPMRAGFDKTGLLERFRSMSFFLIDTCEFPIDKLPGNERTNAIREQAPRIIKQVRELDPDRIVIVKKTVYKPVKAALESGGLGRKILNNAAIPFPSHGNQRRYRTMLRRLLRKTLLQVEKRGHHP